MIFLLLFNGMIFVMSAISATLSVSAAWMTMDAERGLRQGRTMSTHGRPYQHEINLLSKGKGRSLVGMVVWIVVLAMTQIVSGLYVPLIIVGLVTCGAMVLICIYSRMRLQPMHKRVVDSQPSR